jgi:hypothetical protein
MRRGQRSAIIALGLTLTSSSSFAEREKANPLARRNVQAPLVRMNPVIEKQSVDSAPDRGCKAGQENRQSNLCAQWKAADAAAESALWALLALWIAGAGLVVGGGTLIAAWRAAHWARKAAEHTESGAKESAKAASAAIESVEATRISNKIAQQQFEAAYKPWLRVSLSGDYVTPTEQIHIRQFSEGETRRVLPASVTVHVTNIGELPAIISEIVVRIEDPHPDATVGSKSHEMFDMIYKGENIEPIYHAVSGIFRITPENRMDYIQNPPPIIGLIRYLDPFGVGRETGFAFQPNHVISARTYRRWGGPEYNFDRLQQGNDPTAQPGDDRGV